ncbi:MAG: DUF4433 domain-containing protein [bacterium]|nr:DUF4433 domain-containing protein [bacterium]
MKIEDIKELHYITHIDNLLSIVDYGILNYEKAKKKQHKSVANPEVQERRAKVVVPGGKKLHYYANLYFNARNPMMRALIDNDKHKKLLVIQIDISILDEPGVIISDRNASSIEYVRFYSVSDGIDKLNENIIFARYWTDHDSIKQFELKSGICAEVLVPDCIPPKFIKGIYVSCEESLKKAKSLLINSHFADKIFINSDLFFQ